jgi:hypothetical protein
MMMMMIIKCEEAGLRCLLSLSKFCRSLLAFTCLKHVHTYFILPHNWNVDFSLSITHVTSSSILRETDSFSKLFVTSMTKSICCFSFLCNNRFTLFIFGPRYGSRYCDYSMNQTTDKWRFESLPGLIIRLFPSRPDRFGAHAVFCSLDTENSLLPEIKTVNSLYSLQRLRKCQIFLHSFFYVHWELTFNHFCETFVLHDMKRYRRSMCYLLHIWDKEAAG